MISAFGIDHGGISKAGSSADQNDRRMRNVTAGIGGTSSALGGATAGIGWAEHKGKDPMGFTGTNTWTQKPRTAAAKSRILRESARAHGKQAAVAGAVGAAGLGAAGLYQHRLRKKPAISKAFSDRTKSNLTDAAGGAASAAAVGSGVATANMLGSHAHHHFMIQRQDTKDLARRMPKARREWITASRKVSRRVAGTKGAGALAGAGLAGAGGYGLYQSGKHALATNRKKP